MKTQASNLLLFTCIMMLFINCCITVAAYRKPEIVPAKWIVDTETGAIKCSRCGAAWLYSGVPAADINYCTKCGLRAEGVKIEEE